MSSLIIFGDDNYVKKMEKHLHKEHPSTRGHTKIQGLKEELKQNKKPSFKNALKDQLRNMGNATTKVLKDATAPLDKIEKDMKKHLGNLY
jgi:hypothetical protein